MKEISKEDRFFFGGVKQIFLLIISIVFFAILPYVLVALLGINALTILLDTFLVCLGAFGILYYSGFYHKSLRPDILSMVFYDERNLGARGCVHHIIELLDTAQDEVLILSGRLRSDVYEMDSVFDAFYKAFKKNANLKVKIIVGKNFDYQAKRIPELLRNADNPETSIRMYKYPNPEESPLPHFIVIDRRSCRIEKPHEDLTSLDNIEADEIEWHSGKEANRLAHEFEDYWKISSVFSMDESSC